MDTIRVLQVLGRLDRGGAETMLMNLYRNMDRNRVQFDFVLHTQEECAYSEEVRRLGGRIYSVPAFHGKNLCAYRRAWKELLAAHPEYRILHSHIRSSAALYLGIAKRYHMRVLIHSHNTSSGRGAGAAVKTLLQLPLRYQADYLFACGRMAGEWLYGKKACRSQKFRLLPNAIEMERFRYQIGQRRMIRCQMQVQDKLVFGHVGRLEEQKNHRFLLEIFELIYKKRQDAALWLIGAGVLEEELRLLVKEKKLEEAVFFLGNREDVPVLMQGMDCFVFPSLFEGLPVTLIETQAAGLPAVISDRITPEVDVTKLIHRISLKEGAKVWAERAAALAEAARESREKENGKIQRELRAAGYDITESSRWLEQFYCGLWPEKNKL